MAIEAHDDGVASREQRDARLASCGPAVVDLIYIYGGVSRQVLDDERTHADDREAWAQAEPGHIEAHDGDDDHDNRDK